VEVYHRITFTECAGFKFVHRQTSQEDLANRPVVRQLPHNIGSDVPVSPARSGTSEMEAKVETSILDLMKGIRDDVTEIFREELL
jgi:hypothetical protein